MPPRTSPQASPAKGEKASGVVLSIACFSEGCEAVSTLHFEGSAPYKRLKSGDPGWVALEEPETRETVFLCPECAEDLADDEETNGEVEEGDDEGDDLDDEDDDKAS